MIFTTEAQSRFLFLSTDSLFFKIFYSTPNSPSKPSLNTLNTQMRQLHLLEEYLPERTNLLQVGLVVPIPAAEWAPWALPSHHAGDTFAFLLLSPISISIPSFFSLLFGGAYPWSASSKRGKGAKFSESFHI